MYVNPHESYGPRLLLCSRGQASGGTHSVSRSPSAEKKGARDASPPAGAKGKMKRKKKTVHGYPNSAIAFQKHVPHARIHPTNHRPVSSQPVHLPPPPMLRQMPMQMPLPRRRPGTLRDRDRLGHNNHLVRVPALGPIRGRDRHGLHDRGIDDRRHGRRRGRGGG